MPCPSSQHRKVTGRAIFSASITRSLLCCTSVQLFFMIQGGRFRNWVFTLNNPAYALTPELDLVGSPCTFLVWQLEAGNEGTEHYQGYMELDRPCSLLQVLQMGDHMFLGAHFEVIYFAPKLISAQLALALTSGSSGIPCSFVHGCACLSHWRSSSGFVSSALPKLIHVVSPCLLSTRQYHPYDFCSSSFSIAS